MRTIFLGTPAIAVPFLQALHQNTKIQSIVTNPDQPAGRGFSSKAPAVKEAGLPLGVPILQPERARHAEFVRQIKALSPELGLVVAYGKLLPTELLQIPKYGFLNVHFSLLPAYRGAAPMQWTLIHGEEETGVTLFWLDEGMDTGPIFLQEKLSIDPADNAQTLQVKLVQLGVSLLKTGLEKLDREGRTEIAQTGAGSRAPILKKEDGHINWNKPASAVVNQIRGMSPWPGVFGFLGGQESRTRLKILAAEVTDAGAGGAVGSLVSLVSGRGFVIKCVDAYLLITQVQPEGKKPMSAWDYWQGARLKIGETLG